MSLENCARKHKSSDRIGAKRKSLARDKSFSHLPTLETLVKLSSKSHETDEPLENPFHFKHCEEPEPATNKILDHYMLKLKEIENTEKLQNAFVPLDKHHHVLMTHRTKVLAPLVNTNGDCIIESKFHDMIMHQHHA